MTLGDVLAGVDHPAGVPEWCLQAAVAGLDYDSRRIERDFLFFAFPGERTDGRQYAAQAMERGALGVVCESPAPAGFDGLWIQVPHGRRALGRVARNFYEEAVRRITVTGITGTNGKTTACNLIDSILKTTGHLTALVGTIEYHVAGQVHKAANTTPASLDLYRLFEQLQSQGGTHATMEVSSHALALGRVHGLEFRTAVFTNLTRDHLDFHGTMEDYFAAKAALFAGQEAAPPRFAVLNADDAWARRITPAPGCQVIWYGTSAAADVAAGDVRVSFDGLRFGVRWQGRDWDVESPLLGRFNVHNILAAFGAGLSLDIPPEAILEGIRRCRSVAGRFERIDAGQPFLVLVDYAHTDDALRNAIASARDLSPRRLITVFGCGGDRDRAKRPLMGQAAGEGSDVVVLTSDNPRNEDPIAIMNDALVGLRRTDVDHIAEPDRERAIRRAIGQAGAGDVVLVAGKGHETYQVLGDQVIDFDDREVARRVLSDFGYRGRAS